MNVRGHDLFKYSDAVERLRAAIANSAPESVRLNLMSSIRRDGLDVSIDRWGSVLLVQGDRSEIERKISELVDARSRARALKDFEESDRIRDELASMGVTLKDGKDAGGKPTTTWEIAR